MLIRQIIQLRQDQFSYKEEALTYIMRMMLLVRSLKLPGWNTFSPIYFALCGVIQSSVRMQKGMRGKKVVPKVSIEQKEAKPITVLLDDSKALEKETEKTMSQERTRIISNIAEEIIRKQQGI